MSLSRCSPRSVSASASRRIDSRARTPRSHGLTFEPCFAALAFGSSSSGSALAAGFRTDGVQTVLAPAIGGILVAHEVARALGAAVVRVALRAHRLLVVRMLFFAGNTDYVPRLPNADPLLKVSARLAAVAAGLRVDNATEFAVCCDAVIAYLDGTATEDDMRVVEGVMGRMGAHANRTRASLRGFTQHPVRKRRTHARVAAPCAYCARPPR